MNVEQVQFKALPLPDSETGSKKQLKQTLKVKDIACGVRHASLILENENVYFSEWCYLESIEFKELNLSRFSRNNQYFNPQRVMCSDVSTFYVNENLGTLIVGNPLGNISKTNRAYLVRFKRNSQQESMIHIRYELTVGGYHFLRYPSQHVLFQSILFFRMNLKNLAVRNAECAKKTLDSFCDILVSLTCTNTHNDLFTT